MLATKEGTQSGKTISKIPLLNPPIYDLLVFFSNFPSLKTDLDSWLADPAHEVSLPTLENCWLPSQSLKTNLN